jgi:ribonuclease R
VARRKTTEGRGRGPRGRGAGRRSRSRRHPDRGGARAGGRARARRSGDDPLTGVFDTDGRSGIVIDTAGRRFRVEDAHDARPGDRVSIHPWGAPRAPRADLLHVVEGERDHWVGILHLRGRLAFATPYRDDGEWQLRVARSDVSGALDGEVVELVPARERARGRARRRRRETATPWARVTRRLGRPGDPEADVAAVVWRHRLPVAFPEEVELEARERAAEPVGAEIARRVDLRHVPFVTIDPPTARDHDDAIAVQEHPAGGWLLRVAIADVSYYAPPGSLVDREALRRGNSVYFPDRALPMLPAALSSDACSLIPDRDRLALVAELDFDARARLRGRSVFPAAIRSRAKLSYEQAAAAIADPALHPLADMLGELDALTSRLAQRRREFGALTLDLPAAALRVDASGRAVAVARETHGAAHRAVEEAMLATNQAVAALLIEAGVPAVFRNHEPPLPEDVALLTRVLARFDLHDAGRPLDARALSAALARTRDDPTLTRVLHPIALRALRQARYGGECRGHFALASQAYLHFTSPIRRYPDLVVHRVLRSVLAGDPVRFDAERAARIAARCSFRERLAERAERELVDLGKCAFLVQHVGAEVSGCVTGVARHGVYVGLDPWPIEGLVHVSRLPEFVSLDDDGLSLVAERSGRRYAVGDRVSVRVAAVDPIRARIDLEIRSLLEASPLFARPRRRRR